MPERYFTHRWDGRNLSWNTSSQYSFFQNAVLVID